ncbi:unnamed protein product [Rhizophagus irregularis]|nr:unnamed protein product [Rhizophagus irregularis]
MTDRVLCTCIWCLQKSGGQGRTFSQSTRARHMKNQRNTWPTLGNTPVTQRHLVTSTSQFAANTITPLSNSLQSSSANTLLLTHVNQDENQSHDEVQSYIISDEIPNEDKSEISGSEENEFAENYPLLDDEEDEYSENESLLLEDEESEYDETDPLLEDEEDEYNEERDELLIDDNGEISDDLIKGLRLFHLKVEHNISEVAFEKILKSLEIPGISLFKLQKLLGNIIPIKPIIENHHVYFPLKPPAGTSENQYDPKNLPLRTHESYIDDINVIKYANGSSHKRKVQERGVEYLQNDPARLPAALISYHYLLHIATSIRNTGPAWATWQYPMERLCGMLLPLVRSKQHPYTNLQNQITIWTQFSHLQYKSEIYHKIFGKGLEKSINYSENRVFTTDSAEEELQSPSRKYCMDRVEMQRLKAYYITALNENQFKSITQSVQKYGKLRIKNGLIINSKLSNRKEDVARTNYCFSAQLLVDRNAYRPNAPIILEEKEFFGEVQYFFSHQYDEQWSMLAYVQWVRNPQPSGHGPLKFRDLGAFEVINVSAICRSVGFLRMPNNEIYIIDRENRVKFR